MHQFELWVDTFIPTLDVVAALNAQDIVDRVPSSKRAQAF
ncbi:hypothetical protein PSYPI_47763, partial [Pseudomonas syringae pv. pisi str. 1704B]